jgi:TPR repeat protein
MAVAVWAAAASLLVAVGTAFYAWDSGVELAALNKEAAMLRDQVDEFQTVQRALDTSRRQYQQASTSLLLSEKEHLAHLTAKSSQPYLTGTSSTELVRLAVADLGKPHLSKNLSRDEAAAVERSTRRVSAAAAQRGGESAATSLETAAALIQAGRLNEAEEMLDRLGPLESLPTTIRPSAMNVRAALLATKAEALPRVEARPLLAMAEDLFRQAAAAGIIDAQLNLALLLVQEERIEQAREAAARYLELDDNLERRAIIEQAFSK